MRQQLTYGRFTVEAVELDCTSDCATERARDAQRRAQQRGTVACMARVEPVGNGSQLLVRRDGYIIGYVRTPDQALALITGEQSP